MFVFNWWFVVRVAWKWSRQGWNPVWTSQRIRCCVLFAMITSPSLASWVAITPSAPDASEAGSRIDAWYVLFVGRCSFNYVTDKGVCSVYCWDTVGLNKSTVIFQSRPYLSNYVREFKNLHLILNCSNRESLMVLVFRTL